MLRILDLGPAVTLILATPPHVPLPRPEQHAGAQGCLPLPLIYIYFPWQHLFIGALHIWHTSPREPEPFAVPWFFYAELHSNKVAGFVVFGRLRKIIYHLRKPSDSTFIFVLLP